MRTVSRITAEMRRKRAYRLTVKWELAERTRQHEAEIAREAAEFAAFEAAIAPCASTRQWAPYLYMLDRTRELTPAAVDAIKTLFRQGVLFIAPEHFAQANPE